MKIYGLTGGTGSGKSEVAAIFAIERIPVIDADSIGHGLIASGGAAEGAVTESFGKNILTNGTIDRRKLGDIVFNDAEALERLNDIVHPLLYEEVLRQAEELEKQGHSMALLDAAILADKGSKPEWLAGLIVVHSTRDTRCKRLVAQRDWTEQEAYSRIDAQTPTESKIPLADWIIENEGTLKDLRALAQGIAGELRYGRE